MENAITSLQDLKAWFISAESPFFTLYRGTEVKQGNTVAKNDVTSDMTQAWALLEKQITSLSKHGAVIFVHARKKNDNTTTGLSTVFAYNPFATQMYNSSSIGSMLPAPTPQPQGLSIGKFKKW